MIPSFAADVNDSAIRCSKHKEDNWIDVSHKSAMCLFEGCNVQSIFGTDNKREYCCKHKTELHTDIIHAKCIHKGCNLQASFGERNGKRLYCTLHKDNSKHFQLKYTKDNLQNCLAICLSCVRGKDKRHKRSFDLTLEFLYDLYEKQNTQCYYCNTVLNVENMNIKTFNQVSIDRKDSNLGHIKENCVLSCLHCNMSKSDRPIAEYKLFLEFIRDSTKIHEAVVDDAKWATNIMYRAKSINKETDISKDWLYEQFIRQDGRCFYTGVKMIKTEEKRYLFKPSLERVDCAKPYTIDNCVLVCLGANLGRNDLPLDEYLAFLKTLRG